MDEHSAILDVAQAADLLGFHEETVRRMTRSKVLPAVKVGRQWRYDREVLLGWLRSGITAEAMHHADRVRPNVLVTDDDDRQRTYCASILSPDYEVNEARGGHEAVAQLAQRPTDLMVLDLYMPDMNGAAVLEWIKDHGLDLKVVIATGHPDSALMERALRCGHFTLIRKPFMPRDLRSAVEELVPPPRNGP